MIILLLLLVGFFIAEGLAYGIHRCLHYSFLGLFHRSHLKHHQELYPAHDYLSPKYRGAGRDNSTIAFVTFFAPFCLLLFLLLPLKYAIMMNVEFGIVGLINSYCHEWTHITPVWFERFKWFQKLRATHYTHHYDMTRNFGIFTFFYDKLFKTYTDQSL